MEINLQIAPAVLERVPSFKVGAVLYKGIEIADSPQMLKGRLRLFQESLFFDYADRDLSDEPAIKEWQETVALIDPSNTGLQTSLERLLTDIKHQRYIPSADSASDLSRFFSLKYSVPIHIYDARMLKGPIRIEIGGNEEILHVSGESRTFGSLSDQINRCPVKPGTKDALQLVFFRPSTSKDEAIRLLKALTKMFEQIHGGEHISAVIP
ncbi:hypothetical protein COP00_21450 [Bacillus glycinifermentans]|uniref:B3/B4 tRNA-binding domain-containing protein n=1 Tax=Bacillus glycinifermentans TaxID=1664069 RepID=A0A0T6BN56_9BACI|nr:hypothetical protein [Bacillus glycinifermentans]ATH94818.1 hypothetical protein COP00_21450 [Bacillus glycinifermentans]KRT92164.1 hypothetical protein AB447_204420 [Bacillus glycinifermentans]MEC0486846.1 hypothetical protein [Bacillus glycinifermentans]MEC0493958.1 hypothetical protein [Bacillus glycinifermentans]MEC0543219.1 hypothetical protein [Bacillus glycinifermentans]